jgi:hypothetical protein
MSQEHYEYWGVLFRREGAVGGREIWGAYETVGRLRKLKLMVRPGATKEEIFSFYEDRLAIRMAA